MTEENKSKVRIRFQNGAEFEAEGSQAFIEQQRNYFLALLGKETAEPIVQSTQRFQPQPTIPPFPNTFSQQGGEEFIKPTPQNYVWERLMREDGKYVYFRKKPKITPAQSACLLLAGARVLLKKPKFSALELAHCLKNSNIALPTRLDRLLGGEIQKGYLVCQGAKRSRLYQLTDPGFAHIFVLAEKLAKEIN